MKKKVVFFTKETVSEERIIALEKLISNPRVEIVGVFVESVIHTSKWKFLLRTLNRILKGHIFLPEFIFYGLNTFLGTKPVKGDLQNIYTFTELKEIPIYKVKNIHYQHNIEIIKSLNPDIGIIYGHRILKKKLYEIPKDGSINIHHGILPKYAGSHTSFWSLVENEKKVGITIHKVVKKVDAGDILLIKKIPIRQKKAKYLDKQLRKIAPDVLYEFINDYCDGNITTQEIKLTSRKYWNPPSILNIIKYFKYYF